MQDAIHDTQQWFRSANVKLPHRDKKLNSFCILLKNYSIKDSYLYITDDEGSCLIPISAEVTSSFSYENSTLYLKFFNYDSIIIPFVFEDLTELELMVSHFGKSTILFNGHEDIFMDENIIFLRKIKPKSEVVIPSSPQYIAETTILSPIVTDPKCMKIWETRTLTLNTSFYIKEVPLRFNFLTWNVAGKEPTPEVLDDLSKIFNVPVAPADLVVVALEEIEMSVKSVVTGSSHNRERWTDYIKNATSINGNEPFDVIQNQSMGGVYCCALVRHSLAHLVSSSSIQMKKLGANGMLANKAAVIFRWKIGRASLSAISCHLAAHDQNWEQRNSQWHEIVEDLKDDYIVFMGDLNYRINVEDRNICLDNISKKNLDYLYQLDQLTTTQRSDEIIAQFVEPMIKFNPTFKYDIGKDVYDTSPKKRIPSWTDRILIKTATPTMRIGLEDELIFESDAACNYIKNQELFLTDWKPETSPKEFNYPRKAKNICYRSLKCSFSDHRPVHASYKFPVPFEDEERRKLLEEIMSTKYEELKQLSYPLMACEPSCVEFEEQQQETVILKNMALTWVKWSVEKMPKGIVVTPKSGLITASEKCEVTLRKLQPLPPNYKETLVLAYDKPGTKVTINISSKNGSAASGNDRTHSSISARRNQLSSESEGVSDQV